MENGEGAAAPCWKELRYEKVERGKDVIRFLDFGDKMYISIKGEVEVVIALPAKVTLEQGTELDFLIENFGSYVTLDKK